MTDDPQRDRLYRAEADALADVGPRFRRWVDVEAWLGRIVSDTRWIDGFPGAPIEVAVVRRDRSARSSAVDVHARTIHLRDGSWDGPTIVHELAHLADGSRRGGGVEPHGPDFAAVELALVRFFLGFHAFGALADAFSRHGVAAGGEVR